MKKNRLILFISILFLVSYSVFALGSNNQAGIGVFPMGSSNGSSNISGDHNDLLGLQGGLPGEYYHLSLLQYNELSNYNLSDYYNKSEADARYVPYTGATSNVDLNGKNLTNVTKITFANSSYGVWSNSTDIIYGYIAGLV